MKTKEKVLMFQRTIVLVTLWIFLCSNVSFALRPVAFGSRPANGKMPVTNLHRLNELGTAPWYDGFPPNIEEWLAKGTLGVTTNPSIVKNKLESLAKKEDKTELVTVIIRAIEKVRAEKDLGPDVMPDVADIYFALVEDDIKQMADKMRPLWERTDGKEGYVSIEVNPQFAFKKDKGGKYDEDGEYNDTMEQAIRFARLAPNVMIKVPATPGGIRAIRDLTALGVNVNVTLVFSVKQDKEVLAAYNAGAEIFLETLDGKTPKAREAQKNLINRNPRRLASDRSFFASRPDTHKDYGVDKIIDDRGLDKRMKGRAGVALCKQSNANSRKYLNERLMKRGVRSQRLLLASTACKYAKTDPHYHPLLYIAPLVGSHEPGEDNINTLPEPTIKEILNSDLEFRSTISEPLTVDKETGAIVIGPTDRPTETITAEEAIAELTAAGIDLEEVGKNLLRDGAAAFTADFEKTLEVIKQTLPLLQAQPAAAAPPRAFGYGVGTPEEMAALETGRAHFNVSGAVNDGRFFEIFGHNKKDAQALAANYVRKSGVKVGAAGTQKAISERISNVQGLLEKALDTTTLREIVKAIREIDSADDVKAGGFLGLMKGLNLNNMERVREVLIGQTRLVAILAGEGSLEERAQALAAVGDIASSSHRAIVSFGGGAQYEGSQGLEGGPRSIYFDLDRLEAFQKNIKELRLWLIHEYKDLARGHHVDEKPEIMAAITNVHKAIDSDIRERMTQRAKKAATAEKTRITISVFGANIGKFLNSPTVPPELEAAMRSVLDGAVEDGLIADYYPVRCGQRVNIVISHNQGRGSAKVNSLILSALANAIRYAKDAQVYKYKRDITGLSDPERAEEMRLSYGDISFNIELGETLAFAITDSGAPGAGKVLLHRAWTDPRTSDAIPNVALARPGYYFELENTFTGSTQWVHSYDVPNLAALIKEGRYIVRSIRPLKRDEKGNPIPLRNKNYTAAELMKQLGDPIAYSFAETAGFEPRGDADFNEITLARLQQWKGPDSGEFNSPLFVSSPIVPKQNTMAPVIPVSVNDLSGPVRPDVVKVAYLGFEILPDGKLSDVKGYPTQVGDPLSSPKFDPQRKIGERLAGLWARMPENFEPRLKSGARRAELQNAFDSASKIEAVPAIPSMTKRIQTAKQRGKVHTESGFKCDEGGLWGHDQTPLVFTREHREIFMDVWVQLTSQLLSETTWGDVTGKVNRELIASAIERALSKEYNQLASSRVITGAQAEEFSGKAKKLLNNAQGKIDPDKRTIFFPNEICKVGKILLTRDDARSLLDKITLQLYELDDAIKARIIKEAFNDPAVYVFQKGDVTSWYQWSVGDDTGIKVAHNLGRNHPALHTLIKDLYWEVVYRKGPELGVYGLAQDLSPEGATGNTKGTGIASSEIEVDEETAKAGTTIVVNDKSNAGAYSLALLEYLDTLDEPYLVRVLDPIPTKEAPDGTWYYYNSKTQREALQEVLGRIDRYSVYDIQALTGNKLFKEGQVVAAISSEKLFLIFGRYKGKDDAIAQALKRFLDPEKFGDVLKRVYAVIGWNRGLNYGFYYLAPTWDTVAVAHDGPPLFRMLNLPSYSQFDPATGEIKEVKFEFDKPEYDEARADALFAGRQILLGSNPFEGGSKVGRDEAEYSMAEAVERDLETLGLTTPTVRQEFVIAEGIEIGPAAAPQSAVPTGQTLAALLGAI